MASFRNREKQRQVSLKSNTALFSEDAQTDGKFGQKYYPFCLGGSVAGENLYFETREPAIKYFMKRKISWHGGDRRDAPHDLPSRHLCCSQSMCVNVLFPLNQDPVVLASLMKKLGYPVHELLTFNPDGGAFDEPGYVAFEWIGLHNYLGEFSRGVQASDESRTRGAGFTSADFAIRFRRTDGRVQIVLGEWKYTEEYTNKGSTRFSRSRTDRLSRIYEVFLQHPECPIRWSNVGKESLFFDPFDQMMRLQLLAHAMERERELGAEVVSVLHVAPVANRELMLHIPIPELASLGGDIHKVWAALVGPELFKGVHTESIIGILTEHAVQREWADYLRLRYGAMK